jgi:tetratricopeptide (TPR) repeat protein
MPLGSVYAMPLYRLATPGLGSRPVLHTLGAQFGWATINGQSEYYGYYYNGNNGNYLNGTVQMNTYAVVYRLEEMLNARLSLGLELAYHFAWANVGYTNEQYDSSTYTYTYTSYQTTLNYSGPSISLTLAAWPMAPFWTAKDQAAVDQRQARREERLEERLERIEARRGTRDDTQDYDSAAEAKAAGNGSMDKGRFSAAQSAYQQATLLAPGDSQAWRGLANAEYALGKHAKAYTHYKEALRLDPDNQPLRDFVEKLKTRLRQDLDLN